MDAHFHNENMMLTLNEKCMEKSVCQDIRGFAGLVTMMKHPG
jgi:hypothetical protein